MTFGRRFAFAVGLLAASMTFSPIASAQSGDGWKVLLDGNSMDGWNKVGDTNWRVEDGAVVADKLGGKDAAFLVSKDKYKDFQLVIEFWASDDANSGIYMRCADAEKLTDRTCYEAQIFDRRADPTYGSGSIMHHVEIDPAQMVKVGGKWNTYEITAKGRDLTVKLNGTDTAKLRNGMFSEGPIGLQHGAGTIKFRKVAIKPL